MVKKYALKNKTRNQNGKMKNAEVSSIIFREWLNKQKYGKNEWKTKEIKTSQ